ncbi:hemerythrin domain-containing protein [Actinomycetospora aeridis]|uniref:Hemerythrin domain-containing protein n=1 Tax=Actinomycetospora aeridis TaxID=3129231 RepID=A0ABU8NCA5_9PSEU
MTMTWDGQADTRMMGIVHDALRRDLGRTRHALAGTPPPRRRRALAAHLAWLMDLLHAHHTGEDDGLYPLVRSKSPEAADLLDVMAEDHAAIDPAMDALRTAAARWGDSGADDDRRALLAALDDLEAVLLPHLDREENEAMPLVSATITHREWHTWDQRFNIAPKSLPTLAEEGNWLLDGLDPDRRAVVEAEVAWLPRQIVLHVFGPGYRRRAAARWAGTSVGVSS